VQLYHETSAYIWAELHNTNSAWYKIIEPVRNPAHKNKRKQQNVTNQNQLKRQKLVTYIGDVTGSNLGRDIYYPVMFPLNLSRQMLR
jgi:hypothetical protein